MKESVYQSGTSTLVRNCLDVASVVAAGVGGTAIVNGGYD